MSIFDDMTIKPKSSAFWFFAPVVALFIIFIIWLNFNAETGFSWGLFLSLMGGLVFFLLVWKIVSYMRSNDREVREYEAKMKEQGRR